jgi:hypothetical protein
MKQEKPNFYFSIFNKSLQNVNDTFVLVPKNTASKLRIMSNSENPLKVRFWSRPYHFRTCWNPTRQIIGS